MARHLLTAKQLLAAPANCDLADGDGLIVRIKNGNASAVLRFTSPISSKRREMGLGALTRDSLATAGRSLTDMRDAAERARRLLREKKDPIDEERARRDANVAVREKERAAKTAAAATLRRYARAYHEEHVEPIRSGKHVQQWINSIERHVPAWLLDANIATITATELLDALVPIQRDLPETGSRIYQRLATVFDAAVIDGLRADNPATPIKGELRKRAPRPKREGYAAMPYRKLPTFSVALRKVQGNAARCLEFAILTAARTSEALLAE
jgi:hypothetical protein